MDKLSLYEILSFVVPGFVAYKIVESIHVCFFNGNQFLESDNIGDSLLLFCFALFIGAIIHYMTIKFFLIESKRMNKIKKYIFQTKDEIISKDDYLKSIIPEINKEYIALKKHPEDIDLDKCGDGLFHFIYYYLEANDKITAPKNFQSLYFGLRNIFALGFFFSILILALIFYAFASNYCPCKINFLTNWFIGLIVFTIGIVPIARWYREKYITKILSTYYTDRMHNKK